MAANLKNVKKAADDISLKLKVIEDAEKERVQLRAQRDALNEQITTLTQQMTVAKTDLDLAVEALRKAMAE